MLTVDAEITRAVERAKLACRALSAAANDLAIAEHRSGVAVDAATEFNVEVERVCALAEQLQRSAATIVMPVAEAGSGLPVTP